MQYVTLDTKCGKIKGLKQDGYHEFRGVKFANADRFEYATPVTSWEGEFDATNYGDVCIQKRVWYEHLEIPERAFYHKEFREGIIFNHTEDCLNLNIFKPEAEGKYPVVVFIHGGGFDSGSCYDTAMTGYAYATRGIVFVSINYRVGIFGYLTDESIKEKYGREGNFGLDDQFVALQWIKENISDYCGDPENITVLGQSAGAISIQYLCLDEKCENLFKRAIMLSGGGCFPKFALPRVAETTREYWADVMATAGAKDFEELKVMDAKKIFDALEEVKARRKDNTYNTMPVIDGYHITGPVDELIKNPLKKDYMIGYTNRDMYAIIMAIIGNKYAAANNAYVYYFDIDAPGGDDNNAFHSSDLRYVFGSLKDSHRPYDEKDEAVSKLMIDYIVSFAKTGDPNHEGAPIWKRKKGKALHLTKDMSKIKMVRPGKIKLIRNTLKGDPK